MDHSKLNSSTIASAGYDASTRTLQIRFVSGSLYEYLDVPETVYKQLISASSAGRAFDSLVKKPGYAFRQLR